MTIDDNLFNSFDFGENSISQTNWLVSNPLRNDTLVSFCSFFKVLGGYTIFGLNSKLQKQFFNLTHHFRLRITFFFIKIDHWTNRNLLIIVDSTTIFQKIIDDNQTISSNICGALEYDDIVVPIDFVFLHNKSNILLEITTDLDSNLGSWGIFNLSLLADICDKTCNSCSSFGPNACLNCPMGYFLDFDKTCQRCNITTCPVHCNDSQVIFDYACISTCPEHYYVSRNKSCLECDDSCQTCNDASSKNCLSCLGTKYLYQGTCLSDCPESTYKNLNLKICSPCHYSCQSCVGPGKSDCKSCENKTRSFTNVSFSSLFSCDTGTCSCNHGFYDDYSSIYCFGNLLELYKKL